MAYIDYKISVSHRRQTLDRQDREARKVLIEGHNQNYAKKRRELYAYCGSNLGHVWSLASNYMTEDFELRPSFCEYCKMRKPEDIE